jgi:hypothetical protein
VNVWRARGGKRGWEGAGAWEKGFEGMRLRKENEREVQEKKGADGIRNAGATIINCTIFKYSTLLCFLAQHFHFLYHKIKIFRHAILAYRKRQISAYGKSPS